MVMVMFWNYKYLINYELTNSQEEEPILPPKELIKGLRNELPGLYFKLLLVGIPVDYVN
jgi:hypothetical protein